MKFIHRIAFAAGIIISLLSSCKKSSGSYDEYFVRFKWNDSLVTWTTLSTEITRDPSDSNRSVFSLTAASTDTSDILYLNVDFLDTIVETGQFASNLSGPAVTAQFFTAFNSAGQDEFDINNANGLSPSVFTLTLSSVSSSGERGTFSCNYLTDIFSDRVVAITDGEFYVPQ